MKSRDEVVIIMLQLMRLDTLGSRGTQGLKTFLEIRLISSRINQKLRKRRENPWLFKEKIDSIFRANWCSHGVELMATIVAVIVALIPPQMRPRSRRDRTMIAS